MNILITTILTLSLLSRSLLSSLFVLLLLLLICIILVIIVLCPRLLPGAARFRLPERIPRGRLLFLEPVPEESLYRDLSQDNIGIRERLYGGYTGVIGILEE